MNYSDELVIYQNYLDNSGNITKAEFLDNMAGTTTELDTEEKVNEVFLEADRDSNGSIDFIEFFSKLPKLLNL